MQSVALRLMRRMPSRYAETYRWIKASDGKVRRYTFDGYEFLRGFYDDPHRQKVGRKCSQAGWTEACITLAMHLNHAWELDVMYVFPTDDDVSDFSAGRFKPVIEASPELSSFYASVDNVHHKRAGAVNLYFRGARSPSRLKSAPVAGLFLDEFDEMEAGKVRLARDRVTGQDRWWEVNISTPTTPGVGIDHEYRQTDQRRYFMPCPHCTERTDFAWDRVEEKNGEVFVACSACLTLIGESDKPHMRSAGVWRATNAEPATDVHGYSLNKLYVPTVTWRDLVDGLRAAEGSPDPKVLAEWWRGFGEPFVEKGWQLDPDVLRRFAAQDGLKQGRAERPVAVAAGVDAGVRGHYLTILAQGLDGKRRCVLVEKAQKFDQVAARIAEYEATAVVIDAQPNTEASRKLQRALWDKDVSSWLCYYSDSMRGRLKWDDQHFDGPQVTANRTELLDETMGALGTGDVLWPQDAPPDAWEHTKNLRRTLETRGGNVVGRWLDDGLPDHFAHAINYAAIALEVAEHQVHGTEQQRHDVGFEAELAGDLPQF